MALLPAVIQHSATKPSSSGTTSRALKKPLSVGVNLTIECILNGTYLLIIFQNSGVKRFSVFLYPCSLEKVVLFPFFL